MFRKVLLFIAYILCVHNGKKVNAFNLSPVPNIELKEPINVAATPMRKNSSYFGFSILLREKSIIIGAPRGLTEYNSTMIESGVIYQYSFSNLPNQIKPLIFNKTLLSTHSNILIENQWLGASMDGGRKDSENFMVCAPRVIRISGKSEFMNGVCYMAKNSLTSLLDNEIINPLFRSDMQVESRLNSNQNVFIYKYGEQGVSVHLTPNSKEYLIGSPGAFVWQGTVFRINSENLNIKPNIPKMNFHENSYGGYAVASGYLDSVKREQLLYLITLPHGDDETQSGEAFIFNFGKDDEIKKMKKLNGQRYGEFFGYAALIDDINADGLDDILISAPQYSVNDGVDVGVVYVFINRGALNFEQQVIHSPFGDRGRFGTTMSTLGDINLDGYKDIAIGAPFAGGKGSVAIYLGSAMGLSLTNSQIITSATALPNGMFGFGLSKGVDFDQNGFNDFAVGAPAAEQVFVYQTYPVVKINATIKSIPAEIPLNSNRNETQKLQIQVCYNIITNSTKIKETKITLDIDLDNKLKRILLDDGPEGGYLQKNVSAKQYPICSNFSATIKPQTSLVASPMELKYKLIDDARLHYEKNFCKICAIVDPTYAIQTQGTITYKHNCNNIDCYVELAVRSIDMPQNYTLGTSTKFTAVYEITNSGDNAFNTQIEIKTNLNLPIAQKPSDCDIQYIDARVSFDVSNIIESNPLDIEATVSSSGTKGNMNSITSHIEIYKNLTIEMTGRMNETSVLLEKLTENSQMVIDYKIQNSGPSPLAEFHLWILLPVAYKNIQFIDIRNAELYIVMDNFHHLPSSFNITQSETLISNINVNDYDKKNFSLPKDRINIMDCALGKSIQCAESHKVLPHFKPGQNLTLTLKYDIIIKGVEDIMMDTIDYLAIMPHIIIKSSDTVQSNIKTKLEPIIIMNTERKIPLWIYLISSLGGLIFLITLVLVLKKMGFFKRQTKEDMEKIINEQMEIVNMKKEIERATSMEEDDYSDIMCKNYN